MKRLVIAIALFATPFTASASPELASQWGSKAASLHAQTTDLITMIDQGDSPDFALQYLLDVQRFAATATRLGSWIDRSSGAKDLGCIFRGMAAEGEVQLDTLDSADDTATTREALRRLATMFSDAEMVAIASTRRSATPGLASATSRQSCPASSYAALDALH